MVGTLGLIKCAMGCIGSEELKELMQEKLGKARGTQGGKQERACQPGLAV